MSFLGCGVRGHLGRPKVLLEGKEAILTTLPTDEPGATPDERADVLRRRAGVQRRYL
jgi:hypothetical protein